MSSRSICGELSGTLRGHVLLTNTSLLFVFGCIPQLHPLPRLGCHLLANRSSVLLLSSYAAEEQLLDWHLGAVISNTSSHLVEITSYIGKQGSILHFQARHATRLRSIKTKKIDHGNYHKPVRHDWPDRWCYGCFCGGRDSHNHTHPTKKAPSRPFVNEYYQCS